MGSPVKVNKSKGMISVLDVCRAMKVEPTDKLMWSAGLMTRNKWAADKREVEYDLRTKKCGVGVHLFAVYPEWFRPVIEEVIREHEVEESRQMDMFA